MSEVVGLDWRLALGIALLAVSLERVASEAAPKGRSFNPNNYGQRP